MPTCILIPEGVEEIRQENENARFLRLRVELEGGGSKEGWTTLPRLADEVLEREGLWLFNKKPVWLKESDAAAVARVSREHRVGLPGAVTGVELLEVVEFGKAPSSILRR